MLADGFLRGVTTYSTSRLYTKQRELELTKTQIQAKLSSLQELRDNKKAAFTQITSGALTEANSIFNGKISNANTMVADAKKKLSEGEKLNLDAASLTQLKEQVSLATEEANNIQRQANAEYQRQSTVVASLVQAYNNVEAAEQKAQEKALNKQETEIDKQLNDIKVQIQMNEKMHDEAEKREQETIQSLFR